MSMSSLDIVNTLLHTIESAKHEELECVLWLFQYSPECDTHKTLHLTICDLEQISHLSALAPHVKELWHQMSSKVSHGDCSGMMCRSTLTTFNIAVVTLVIFVTFVTFFTFDPQNFRKREIGQLSERWMAWTCLFVATSCFVLVRITQQGKSSVSLSSSAKILAAGWCRRNSQLSISSKA